MKWLDAALGRSRPVRAQFDGLFGLSTGVITLETTCGLTPSGGAAISFKPVSTGEFSQLRGQIDALLKTSSQDAPLESSAFTDPYGYQWIILRSDDFTNLITSIHMVSRELQDAGYGEQLLASVFQFREPTGRNVYWLYNYKRGSFYPFVPSGKETRDNAAELRLSSVMARELVMEGDLTKWYALWGIPLD